MMRKHKVFVIALTSLNTTTAALPLRNDGSAALRKRRRHLKGKSSKDENHGNLFQHSQTTKTK
jgi:Spy/CpxP family protein refolding chaperone